MEISAPVKMSCYVTSYTPQPLNVWIPLTAKDTTYNNLIKQLTELIVM